MRECRFEVPRVEVLGEGEEGLWMFLKVTDVEDGFGVGEVVGGQVGVEAGGGGAEVGDGR